jgi:hypothetical protein
VGGPSLEQDTGVHILIIQILSEPLAPASAHVQPVPFSLAETRHKESAYEFSHYFVCGLFNDAVFETCDRKRSSTTFNRLMRYYFPNYVQIFNKNQPFLKKKNYKIGFRFTKRNPIGSTNYNAHLNLIEIRSVISRPKHEV